MPWITRKPNGTSDVAYSIVGEIENNGSADWEAQDKALDAEIAKDF